MDTIKHSIDIDLARKTNVINRIEIKKNDSKSHEFIINLYNNSVAFNLLDLTAKIYFKKQDSTIIFQDCTITDPNGKLSCILETQTLSYPGTVEAEVTVYGISEEVVTTITFSFTVVDILRDDSAIESTSEFTALTAALAQVTNFTNVKNELDAAKHDNVTNEDFANIGARMDSHSSQLSDLVEYLNYMPINGGDFDGSDNLNVTIDGGTY